MLRLQDMQKSSRYMVTLAVVEQEVRQALRSVPLLVGIVLAGVLLYAGYYIQTSDSSFPEVSVASANSQLVAPFFGLWSMLHFGMRAGSFSKLRVSRTLSAMPTGPAQRTLALSAASLVTSFVWALIVLVLLVPKLSAVGAVTGIAFGEVMVGVSVVALMNAVGIVIGTYTSRVLPLVAGSVMLLVLANLPYETWNPDLPWYLLSSNTDLSTLEYVAGLPSYRPAWTHVGYLLSFVAMLCCVALFSTERKKSIAAFTVATIGFLTFGVVQANFLKSKSSVAVADSLSYVCEQRDQHKYCFLKEYRGRVDSWHSEVSAISESLPAGAALPKMRVVQALDRDFLSGRQVETQPNTRGSSLEPGEVEIPVSQYWTKADGWKPLARRRLGFATDVASIAVMGTPMSGQESRAALCDSRGVLTLFLAGLKDSESKQMSSATAIGNTYRPNLTLPSGKSYRFVGPVITLAEAFAGKTGPQRKQLLEANWASLSRGVSLDEVAALLGVPAPKDMTRYEKRQCST